MSVCIECEVRKATHVDDDGMGVCKECAAAIAITDAAALKKHATATKNANASR